MAKGQLIVAEVEGGLNILGITDLDPDVEPLVGTGETKEATVLTADDAGDRLEGVVTRHIRGGEKVIEGYVKFAHPVKITGTKAGMAALQELLKPKTRKGQEKKAAHELFIIESPLHEWLELVAAGDMEKAAVHPFNAAFIEALEGDKHDAGELGFPVPPEGYPIKATVRFANKEAEELFARASTLFKGKKAAAIDSAVTALAQSGAVSSPLVELAAAVEADPTSALTKIAAHYALAIKQKDGEKAAAIRALLGVIGKSQRRQLTAAVAQ